MAPSIQRSASRLLGSVLSRLKSVAISDWIYHEERNAPTIFSNFILHQMKPPMNTDKHSAAAPQPKRISPRRRTENAEVPWERTLPASSVLKVSNILHAGCVRSQEHTEENPWQLNSEPHTKTNGGRGKMINE